MDSKALFKIGYGLYVLTAREQDKDNGCIVNTLIQVTGDPCRISVTVCKENYTCGMIERTGAFNISVLSEKAVFSLFQRFGFQSGSKVDKFDGFPCPRRENGILCVEETANAWFSGKVFQVVDLGTHLMFLADVTDAGVLNDAPTASYSYYRTYIKPAPAKSKKTGWRCPICGYFHEGDALPEDFVCPLCKHSGREFVKVQGEEQGSKGTEHPKGIEQSRGAVPAEPAVVEPVVAGKKTKTLWSCPKCGYIHEADELPAGFVCPICRKSGAEFDKAVVTLP